MKYTINNENNEETMDLVLKDKSAEDMGSQVVLEINQQYGIYFRKDKSIDIYADELEKLGFKLNIIKH